MERLTKYGETSHENGVCCTHFNSAECRELAGNCAYGCKWEEEAWSKLAHYEDLEEQGRLVELPCKVGEEVWEVVNLPDIFGIDNAEDVYDIMPHLFTLRDYEDFGKTVFLTKEEAEAKLEELKGE